MPREAKPACKAVLILTQQFFDTQAQSIQQLGELALDAAGLSVKDGWRYNIQLGELERTVPDEAPAKPTKEKKP